MQQFEGRTAVVTGAASGIGRGLVEAALDRGMRVVAADIEARRLDSLTDLGAGDRLITFVCDVSKSESVKALADAAFDRFGKVHLLFNNAGVLSSGKCWEQTPAEFAWLLGVNLMGPIHGVRHFVPRMLAAGEEGVVVNTASMAGLLASTDIAAYSASKAALVSFSESLLFDLAAAKAKVTAAVICPGAVNTDIMHSERLSSGSDVTVHRSPGLQEAFAAGMAQAGMAPRAMAEIVFDHLKAGRFWIFPHPDMLPGAQARLDTLLKGEVPAYQPMV